VTVDVRGALRGLLGGATAVLLPGTGSDDEYLLKAFGDPLRDVGAVPVAVAPEPTGVVAGYLRALDAAAAHGPIVVAGVSLGAAVAAAWSLAHPDRTVAVLAALPAWTGAPDEAPASLSARHTAALLRRDGLAATTAAMRASSPVWLADELTRSWRRQWPALPDAMDEAAAYVAPNRHELAGLTAPMGVAAVEDDPIHPISVAREWVAVAPRAALRTITFDEFGPNPPALGATCLTALADALQHAG
jgi:pimeloyl-ACP methyl ester carboxylesterase